MIPAASFSLMKPPINIPPGRRKLTSPSALQKRCSTRFTKITKQTECSWLEPYDAGTVIHYKVTVAWNCTIAWIATLLHRLNWYSMTESGCSAMSSSSVTHRTRWLPSDIASGRVSPSPKSSPIKGEDSTIPGTPYFTL